MSALPVLGVEPFRCSTRGADWWPCTNCGRLHSPSMSWNVAFRSGKEGERHVKMVVCLSCALVAARHLSKTEGSRYRQHEIVRPRGTGRPERSRRQAGGSSASSLMRDRDT